MPQRREDLTFLTISILFFAFISLPYLLAFQAAGSESTFAGFLFNPIDGHSYLAKMQQGWRGMWQFSLPYTAEPGEGTYLFLYYLSLGHLARLAGLPLVLVFHLARLAGALCLLLALRRFLWSAIPPAGPRLLAFALAALGSGLGWLAVPFGGFTADLWVAEAYPLLSSYANPHFPLGLAIMLALLTPSKRWSAAAHLVLGLLLAIVMPFGVVIALLVMGGLAAWESGEIARSSARSDPAATAIAQSPSFLRRVALPALRSPAFRRLLPAAVGSLPVLIYDVWVTRTHPVLAGWNAQNLTPSPAWWDTLLSFSPALVLAIPGARQAIRAEGNTTRALTLWAILGALLLYLPFGLQRRFAFGLFIPFAALAALGIDHFAARWPGRRPFLIAGLFLLALPTNLLVLLAGAHGIQAQDPQLYTSRAERRAFEWIAENLPEQAVFLASPETGLLIPSQTGRRVVYGHPFETVPAVENEIAVRQFFGGGSEGERLDLLERADYLFIGPRERAFDVMSLDRRLQPVYDQDGVTIYLVHE